VVPHRLARKFRLSLIEGGRAFATLQSRERNSGILEFFSFFAPFVLFCGHSSSGIFVARGDQGDENIK
jgi:hypothetical protein